jgi:hypothetical protein
VFRSHRASSDPTQNNAAAGASSAGRSNIPVVARATTATTATRSAAQAADAARSPDICTATATTTPWIEQAIGAPGSRCSSTTIYHATEWENVRVWGGNSAGSACSLDVGGIDTTATAAASSSVRRCQASGSGGGTIRASAARATRETAIACAAAASSARGSGSGSTAGALRSPQDNLRAQRDARLRASASGVPVSIVSGNGGAARAARANDHRNRRSNSAHRCGTE